MSMSTQRVVIRLVEDFYLQLRMALLAKRQSMQDYITKAIAEQVQRDGLLSSPLVVQMLASGAASVPAKLTDAQRLRSAVVNYMNENKDDGGEHGEEYIRLRELQRTLLMKRERINELAAEAGIVITADPWLAEIKEPKRCQKAWVLTVERWREKRAQRATVAKARAKVVDADVDAPTTDRLVTDAVSGKSIRIRSLGEALDEAKRGKR